MKLKFCIVDNSVSFTGAFKCAFTEAQLLKDQFDFVFVVPEKSSVINKLKEESLPYYTLPILEISRSPKKLLQYLPRLMQNAVRLKKILQKERVAVLQMNDFYNLLGVSVKQLGYKGKLLTYVRFLPNSLPGPLRKIWTTVGQKYADALIAVSDAVLKQLPPHQNTVRVYDAIWLPEGLNPTPTNENKKVQLLYLANYIQGKGQDHAIKAFAAATAINKNIELTFVGSDMGLEKNAAFKTELQQFVKEHQLEELVHFEAFQTNIENSIKKADIVLNFSEAESFSMTCAEASYYGRPVIATRCGGPEEIVQHQKTGLLVDNKNVAQMTEAILTLAANADLRKQYGEAAKTFVRQQFSKENYIQNLKTVLKKIGVPHEA